jgi:hypothetical protein
MVIDVARLLQQVQNLISKIIIAMQYLFLFAVVIGGLIVMAVCNWIVIKLT